MDAKLKAEWLIELRSGKYTKGVGSLRDNRNDTDLFCCLGVFCDMVDPNSWENDGAYWYHGNPSRREYPSPEIGKLIVGEAYETDVMPKAITDLCYLNDHRVTWDEVIAYIEENL